MKHAEPTRRPRRRLALVFALLAGTQALIAGRALTIAPELAALASVPMALDAVAGALWAGVWTVQAWQAWHGRRLAAAAWAWLAFAAYYAARWIGYVRAAYDRERLPVLLLATALLSVPAAFYVLKQWQRRTMPVQPRRQTAELENRADGSESQN